jgi:outer membrane protein assembly factor BamB
MTAHQQGRPTPALAAKAGLIATRVAACLAVTWLSACGGGGGGGGGASTPAPSFQLSFEPGTLSASFYEGEPSMVSVKARASQPHSAPVQVAIVDNTGILGSGVQITANATLVYEALLPLSATLKAGSYSGTLEVRVCEDLPTTCSKPVGGSPWRLPYQLNVQPQTLLKPLSPVPGAAAWAGYLGDASHSATTALTLSAGDFSRRWKVDAASSTARESLPIVAGGLVITVVSDRNTGAPALVARREHDGSEAWRRPLGTVNDTAGSPTVADGSVYVFTADYDRTVLWRVDAATGQLLGQKTVGSYTAQQTGPLALAGKLYSCRQASTAGGLTRHDALSLAAESTVALPDVRDTCAPASDGHLIYLFANRSLITVNAASGQLAYSTAVDGVPAYASATPVLDGAGRAFVAVYSQDTQVDGSGRLLAFDVNTRQLLWQQQGGFSTTPLVSGSTVFIVNGRNLEARSISNGALLWTWQSNASTLGDMASALVATRTHVFVSSRWTTDAIDLSTHARVWGENVGGALALSPQGVLYITPYFTGGMRAINLR